MKTSPVLLTDAKGNPVASLQVSLENSRFTGTVDLSSAPPAIRDVFMRFEEIVEGQILSLLDSISDEIEQLDLRAVYENAKAVPIDDLQVYPTTGHVTFKIQQPLPVR